MNSETGMAFPSPKKSPDASASPGQSQRKEQHMKRKVVIILTLTLAAWILAGCDPSGQPCNRVGDVKAQNGHNYTCVEKDGNPQWDVVSTDLGVGTWSYHGHGHA